MVALRRQGLLDILEQKTKSVISKVVLCNFPTFSVLLIIRRVTQGAYEFGLTTEPCSSIPSSEGESRTGSMTGAQRTGSSLARMGTVFRRAADFFLLSRSRSSEPDVDVVVDELMSAMMTGESALVAMWGDKMSRLGESKFKMSDEQVSEIES